MQDAVCGATERHHHDEGVFEALPGEEAARGYIVLHACSYGGGYALTLAHFGGGCGWGAGGAGKGQAQRFDGGGHGVRRVHPAACAWARTRVLLDVGEDVVLGLGRIVWVVESVVEVCAVRLEAVRDVDGFPQGLRVAWLDCPPVQHDGGAVCARKGHDASRHVLVAPGDRDGGVVALGAGYGLEAVGYEFAGLEGEAHSC